MQGRHKQIETPEEFLRLFFEFRDWKLEQKVYTQHITKAGDIVEVPHTPPLSWRAFDAWLFEHKILTDSQDYRQNTDNRYEEFKGVVHAINNILFTHKFDGAAVGAYKENIIARDLGLRDAKDVNNTGSIQVQQITGMEVK